MALWGGRFSLDRMKHLNSLMIHYLICHGGARHYGFRRGRRAKSGGINDDEHRRLVAALHELLEQVQAQPESVAISGEEDIQFFVEAALIDKAGDLAKKHTGRSCNDQVATDSFVVQKRRRQS